MINTLRLGCTKTFGWDDNFNQKKWPSIAKRKRLKGSLITKTDFPSNTQEIVQSEVNWRDTRWLL